MQHMRMALVAMIVLALSLAASIPASAQDKTAARPVNVNLLPISLHRIQRAIQESRSTANHEGLHLRYQIDVYGQAPPIQFLTKGDDLRYGEVPRSAPTHQDMLYMMTPQEFRSPPADLSAVMRWLAGKTDKK